MSNMGRKAGDKKAHFKMQFILMHLYKDAPSQETPSDYSGDVLLRPETLQRLVGKRSGSLSAFTILRLTCSLTTNRREPCAEGYGLGSGVQVGLNHIPSLGVV